MMISPKDFELSEQAIGCLRRATEREYVIPGSFEILALCQDLQADGYLVQESERTEVGFRQIYHLSSAGKLACLLLFPLAETRTS